jgi:hypothetical protein
MKVINELLQDSNDNLSFEFNKSEDNQIKNLKVVSKHIPNTAGLYLVLCEKKSKTAPEHLLYKIKGKEYILCYFGKAGGKTKQGKLHAQGLKGRINNVVKNISISPKYIKRAKYWNIIMGINDLDKFYIRCLEMNEPQKKEDEIYLVLNSKNLKYPLMNKYRGRKQIITFKIR